MPATITCPKCDEPQTVRLPQHPTGDQLAQVFAARGLTMLTAAQGRYLLDMMRREAPHMDYGTRGGHLSGHLENGGVWEAWPMKYGSYRFQAMTAVELQAAQPPKKDPRWQEVNALTLAGDIDAARALAKAIIASLDTD